jgi:hypothetical protein
MDPDELDFDDPILDKDGKPITKEIAALVLGTLERSVRNCSGHHRLQ